MFNPFLPIDETACLIPPYEGLNAVLPSLTANLFLNRQTIYLIIHLKKKLHNYERVQCIYCRVGRYDYTCYTYFFLYKKTVFSSDKFINSFHFSIKIGV